MSEMRSALLCSLTLQSAAKKVKNGDALDFAEQSLLREVADAKLFQLVKMLQPLLADGQAQREDAVDELEQLQKACSQMARCVQTTCLALDRACLDPAQRRLARDILENQVIYVQACLQRSLLQFRRRP